jgi:hypothetical protein
MPTSDMVAQLYPQAPDFLFVVFCDSQGYCGGILTASTQDIHNIACVLDTEYVSFSLQLLSEIFLFPINNDINEDLM